MKTIDQSCVTSRICMYISIPSPGDASAVFCRRRQSNKLRGSANGPLINGRLIYGAREKNDVGASSSCGYTRRH